MNYVMACVIDITFIYLFLLNSILCFNAPQSSSDYYKATSVSASQQPSRILTDYYVDVLQKYSEFPWQVAIYDAKKNFFCSGVIISPHLVLSTAHCFYNGTTKSNAENYEIVVSKSTVDYSVRDNEDQKAYKIKKIIFTDEGPTTLENRYANDIVILITAEAIIFGATVSPACLDWTGKKFQPKEKILGTVVGITTDSNGNNRKTFQSADLPFINFEQCLKILPKRIAPTSEKFCAGFQGRKVGDSIPWGSGAGLIFPEGSSYHVRGLLHRKPSEENDVALFADLSHYVKWISKIRDPVERNRTPAGQNLKCDQLRPNLNVQNYWYIPK